MKKQVIVEQSFCDLCGKEASGYTCCLCCGKELCYDCRETAAKEYKHAVHLSGSGDSLYCLECDRKLRENGDKLHAAYRKIEALRHEEKGWYEDFRKRSDDAESKLKALQGKG